MECKDQSLAFVCTISWDLIETLWNVKYSLQNAEDDSKIDLIETLWNVKEEYRNGSSSQIKI